MKQEVLDKMKNGEKLVEIKEILDYKYAGITRTVFALIIYTCVDNTSFFDKIFGIKRRVISTDSFSFYFETKELAEEFVKYYDNFLYDTYYYADECGENHECFTLETMDSDYSCYMVDAFKNEKHKKCRTNKDFLEEGGVWGGLVYRDGLEKGEYSFYIYKNEMKYFIEEFNNELPKKEGKSYIYKLEKELLQNE